MWPPKFSDAIEACNVTSRRCEHVITAGLGEPDVNIVASTLVIARDCARITAVTAQLMERGSKQAFALADICANVCEELAEACVKHSKIEAFSRCSEACRTCAAECRKIAEAKKAV